MNVCNCLSNIPKEFGCPAKNIHISLKKNVVFDFEVALASCQQTENKVKKKVN